MWKQILLAATAVLAAEAPAWAETAGQMKVDDRAIADARKAIAESDSKRIFTDKAYAQSMLRHFDVLQATDFYSDPEGKRAVDTGRMLALLGAGRNAESFSLARSVVRQEPGDPQLHYLAFFIGAYEDPNGALEELEFAERSITNEQMRRDFAAGLDDQLVFALRRPFAQKKDEERLARSAQALLALGWPDDEKVDIRDQLRLELVEAQLKQGNVADAKAIAAALLSVDAVLHLVVAKKYEAAIDGDRFERLDRAISAFDIQTDRLQRAKPDNYRLLFQRAQFLRSIGRDAAALDLLMPRITDMAAVKAAGEDAFWAVNEAAYALLALDRGDEAVALMDQLQALGVKDHPELISMIINKGEVMMGAGRYAASAEHAVALAKDHAEYASPYGRMWMWEGAACGYALDGKGGMAAPWLAKLRQGKDDNPAALTRALLCANDLDGAAAVVIQRLKDESESMMVALQDYRTSTTTPKGVRILEERWRQVIERPEVRAAIAEQGRIYELPLSKTYWGNY